MNDEAATNLFMGDLAGKKFTISMADDSTGSLFLESDDPNTILLNRTFLSTFTDPKIQSALIKVMISHELRLRTIFDRNEKTDMRLAYEDARITDSLLYNVSAGAADEVAANILAYTHAPYTHYTDALINITHTEQDVVYHFNFDIAGAPLNLAVQVDRGLMEKFGYSDDYYKMAAFIRDTIDEALLLGNDPAAMKTALNGRQLTLTYADNQGQPLIVEGNQDNSITLNTAIFSTSAVNDTQLLLAKVLLTQGLLVEAGITDNAAILKNMVDVAVYSCGGEKTTLLDLKDMINSMANNGMAEFLDALSYTDYTVDIPVGSGNINFTIDKELINMLQTGTPECINSLLDRLLFEGASLTDEGGTSGVPDAVEALIGLLDDQAAGWAIYNQAADIKSDKDLNGIPDVLDSLKAEVVRQLMARPDLFADNDGDGIPDIIKMIQDLLLDTNHNGVSDYLEGLVTGPITGWADVVSLDNDADNLPDVVEMLVNNTIEYSYLDLASRTSAPDMNAIINNAIFLRANMILKEDQRNAYFDSLANMRVRISINDSSAGPVMRVDTAGGMTTISISGVLIKALGIYALCRVFYNVIGMTPAISLIFMSLGILSMLVGSKGFCVHISIFPSPEMGNVWSLILLAVQNTLISSLTR